MTLYEIDLERRTFKRYLTINEILSADYGERIYFTNTQREEISIREKIAEKRKEIARGKLSDLCTILNSVALKKMQEESS